MSTSVEGDTNPSVGTNRPTPKVAIVGLVLAIVVPPIGLFVSLIAWFKVRKHRLEGKAIAITGSVLGAVLTAFLVLLAFWAYSVLSGLGAGATNAAQTEFVPIANRISAIGGVERCQYGDGGHGWDNKIPWFSTYYTMPNIPNLKDELVAVAQREGFDLAPEVPSPLEMPRDPNVTYLIAEKNGRTLRVALGEPLGAVLSCQQIHGGKPLDVVASGESIVRVSLSLPEMR